MNEMQQTFLKLKQRPWLALIIFILLVSSIFIIKNLFVQKKMNREMTKPVVAVETVERRDMSKRISFYGETVANIQVDISPKYSGRIKAVYVSLGQRVEAGELLILQDNEDVAISIDENKAQIRQAQAELTEEKSFYQASYDRVYADYQRSKIDYERYQTLYETGAISKQNLDEKEQAMVNCKAALDTLENQWMDSEVPAVVEAKIASLNKLNQKHKALTKEKEDLYLRAPCSGIIGFRNAEIGAFAQVGQRLLSVINNDKFYVDCELAEGDIAAVQTGMQISMHVDALQRDYLGTIIYVSPAVDKEKKAYTMRIELDKTDEILKSGMFVSSEIEIIQRTNTLFVPKESLVEKNGQQYLYIVNEKDEVRERKVTIGFRNDESVEICSGLQAGETVVVTNLARMKDKIKVQREENGQKWDGE